MNATALNRCHDLLGCLSKQRLKERPALAPSTNDKMVARCTIAGYFLSGKMLGFARGCARFDTIERISSSCVSTDHALHQDSDHYSDLSPDASPGLVWRTNSRPRKRQLRYGRRIGSARQQHAVPLAPRSPSLVRIYGFHDHAYALTLEAGNSIRTTTPGPARVISEANADIIPDINTAAPPNTAANTGETHQGAGISPNGGAQLGGH
ncbi:hypothetical protein EVAR_87415_1 [Eumeta japonica]|uniref:Uncharacterized protein n=1 Tax=Eumeta variegata TaxID=151549 RepID=A0A4C1XIP5_EUMVA|nr:hypothetical protein EVAR_87415_1 [Eumeta japonica]